MAVSLSDQLGERGRSGGGGARVFSRNFLKEERSIERHTLDLTQYISVVSLWKPLDVGCLIMDIIYIIAAYKL
jgi:hypothetical protein